MHNILKNLFIVMTLTIGGKKCLCQKNINNHTISYPLIALSFLHLRVGWSFPAAAPKALATRSWCEIQPSWPHT